MASIRASGEPGSGDGQRTTYRHVAIDVRRRAMPRVLRDA
jgi:hypothetical protein